MTPWEEAQRAYAERRLADALRACDATLEAAPRHGDALHLGAVAAQALGDYSTAENLLRRALALAPADAELHLVLGRVRMAAGRPADAEAPLREAARLAPRHPQPPLHLGILLRDAGRLAEAEASFRRALELDPRSPATLGFLGNLLLAAGRAAEALPLLQAAAGLAPDAAEAQYNFAKALDAAGHLSEAMDRYGRALALRPAFVEARTNLAVLQAAAGRTGEALAGFREALAQDPERWPTRSAYLFHLHRDPDQTAASLLEAHRAWTAAPAAPPMAARTGKGKLRIGFLSPDFRRHSCAYFLEPLLANLDRASVEVLAFADLAQRDDMTERLAALCDAFTETADLRDEALVTRLRAAELDVLVDLAGHTADNRMAVFAARCAPLQVTWLGYPGTTGLAAMDLRLSDTDADPPGFENHHSERLFRLPHFLCYGGDAGAPEPGPPPLLARGYPTFGSFNTLPKLHDGVLRLWGRLLAAAPGARLLLKGHRAFNDPKIRAWTQERLEAAGLDPARVDLAPMDADHHAHLARYRDMDVALDPFPYNGTTTTCEALWMGVPVVALEGSRHAARVGCSLLRAAGHGEWLAGDEEAYLARALALVRDPAGLADTRQGLRAQVAASPLCDGPGFARAFTGALREALGRRPA
ncbi:MAG: tetratricopeptide repeat protein [Holophagaceae bacterium]|nr:tetratricopeptide repeat protein [Holophagaceae bacterium]